MIKNLLKDHPSTHENIMNNKNKNNNNDNNNNDNNENNNNNDQNLIKELIGDKPGRLVLQLPRLKYDISVRSYEHMREEVGSLFSKD